MNDQEDKDTEDWLAVLAGREAANADPATVREAQALREELLFRDSHASTDSRVLDNILAECKPPVWKRPKVWGLPLAASVFLAVILWPLLQPEPESFRPKSAPVIAQTLLVANPGDAALGLLTKLVALGLSVTIRKQGESWIVEVPGIPDASVARVSEILKSHRLLMPPDKRFKVKLSGHPPTEGK
ncbi:MAG: DUF2339 domain-containing protein [Gammaproteobacteria bacterium]|nr:DUF2339 domain-containing protein [Gammaproteobacteria bacterium]